jgi:hypothetical protein
MARLSFTSRYTPSVVMPHPYVTYICIYDHARCVALACHCTLMQQTLPQVKLELPACVTQLLVTCAKPEPGTATAGPCSLRAFARDLNSMQAARFAPLVASSLACEPGKAVACPTEVSALSMPSPFMFVCVQVRRHTHIHPSTHTQHTTHMHTQLHTYTHTHMRARTHTHTISHAGGSDRPCGGAWPIQLLAAHAHGLLGA